MKRFEKYLPLVLITQVCLFANPSSTVVLELNELAEDSSLWDTADRFPNGWSSLPWFGYFVELEDNWIFHLEHGYQYCIGEDLTNINIYDLGLKSWIWTGDNLYPYLYKRGENFGWHLYLTGGTCGHRWFWRACDASYVVEAEINNGIQDVVPAGYSIIPEGEFVMGDSCGGGYLDELPVHTVNLSAFCIQQKETTNAQVESVMNWAIGQGLVSADASTVRNLEGDQQELLDLDDIHCQIYWDGSRLVVDDGKEDYPCVEITWYGAMAYCHYLTCSEGVSGQAVDLSDWSMDISAIGYRLPTEAEWEKAARGGQERNRFPWGHSISHARANYYADNSFAYDNSATLGKHPEWGKGFSPYTCPVGSFSPAGYDLYEMIGNVWEWCFDCLDSNYYADSPAVNPVGPAAGVYRVSRGGDYYSEAILCRSAARHGDSPDNSGSTGVRPVRTLSW